MKIWLVKIVVLLFLLSVLFLNKEDGNHLFGWSINVLFFAAFIYDLKTAMKFNFNHNVYGFRMLILSLFGFVSIAWTPYQTNSLLHIQVLLIMVANSFILYYFIVHYKVYNLLVYMMLIYSFINYSLAFHLSFFGFLQNRELQDFFVSRFLGTEANPNFLAITLIFSILLSLLSFYEKSIDSKWLNFVHVLNIILAIYTIFLTGSRKGILFGCLLVFIFLIMNTNKWFFAVKKYILYIAVFVVVLTVIKIDVIYENISPSIERFSRMISSAEGDDQEGSTVGRIKLIKAGWEGFTQSPWIGYGINSFSQHYGLYAHNNYIELLYSLGFLGPVIFYSIHFSLLKKLLKHKKGMFLIAFIIILMLMDIGLVSYREKRVMLMFLTVIIFTDNLILEKQKEDYIKEV